MLSKILTSQSSASKLLLSDPLAFLKQATFHRPQNPIPTTEPPISTNPIPSNPNPTNESFNIIPKAPSSARNLWKIEEEILNNHPNTNNYSRENSPSERDNQHLGERSRIKRTALDLTKRRGDNKENSKVSKFGLKALTKKLEKDKAPMNYQKNVKWSDKIQEADGVYDPMAMIKRTQSPVKTRGRMETEGGGTGFKGFNIELMNSKLKDINRKIAHVESIKKSANKRPNIKY